MIQTVYLLAEVQNISYSATDILQDTKLTFEINVIHDKSEFLVIVINF